MPERKQNRNRNRNRNDNKNSGGQKKSPKRKRNTHKISEHFSKRTSKMLKRAIFVSCLTESLEQLRSLVKTIASHPEDSEDQGESTTTLIIAWD